MDLLTDGLLIAATLFAGGYCWVLSSRVRDLKSLDKGLGASIVQLTRQVELARQTLETSKADAEQQRLDLSRLVERADTSSHQLRVLIASSRDKAGPPATEPALPENRPTTKASKEPSAAEAPEAADRTETPEAGATASNHVRPSGLPDLGVAVNLPEVPKPRQLPPMSAPLRLFTNENPPQKRAQDEMDILEALRSIASGGA